MPRLSEAAQSRAAHLSRRRHPAPWSQPRTREIERVTIRRPERPAPAPVFVDESGRRRQVGRLVGVCVGTLVLGYVIVAALTFAGAPVVGLFAPPGLGELSRPAGDAGPGVGPDAEVSPLPAASSAPAGSATGPVTVPAQASPDAVEPLTASSTTSSTLPTTTNAALPGQSATTSVPTPSSTVPERTLPTGGPPAEPPGKP
jgi:hypothetical protein